MKIRYGANDYSSGIPNFVEQVEMHPGYKSTHNMHDIAMLRLSQPVRHYTHTTRVILTGRDEKAFALSWPKQQADEKDSNTVQVSGWGRVGPLSPTSKELLVTNLTLVELAECSRRWNRVKTVNITEGVLCAGDSDSGPKSACRGDSGGPLTRLINGVETLVGVVSIGASNCYSADLPNIFTSVFHYRDWIASTLY